MHLQICNDIPFGRLHPCTTIYDSTWDLILPQDLYAPQVLEDWEKGLTVTSIRSPFSPAQVIGVRIETRDGSIVDLSEQCIEILLYPYQLLRNLKDEDITCTGLQIWLLGISFIVVLYGSVPHTLAALISRALSTGWAVYATWRGPTFDANFQELMAGPTSPCSLDLFSIYWRTREVYQIIDLTLSSSGVIIFSYLSWTLLKVYNTESVKCVGAPIHVVRVQKFFMALLSTLYLGVFVLITCFGLWHKNVSGKSAEKIFAHAPVYRVLCIMTFILLLPWITMGWYSIRREKKRMMVIFLGIGLVITVGWAVLFYSEVYRWSFEQWPYLACYTVASFTLLIASLVLGIICRMNFGKGLAQYLHAESTLASLNFAPGLFSHDATTTVTPPIRTIDEHSLKELNTKIPDLEDQSFQLHSKVYFITSLPTAGSDGGTEFPHSQKYDARL